jgi:hypothetical protein
MHMWSGFHMIRSHISVGTNYCVLFDNLYLCPDGNVFIKD